MSSQTFSGNAFNTAMAAFAGLLAAVTVKFILDEATEPDATTHLLRNPRNAARLLAAIENDKYQQMREAARDPQYLADMQEVNNDFAFADAELL